MWLGKNFVFILQILLIQRSVKGIPQFSIDDFLEDILSSFDDSDEDCAKSVTDDRKVDNTNADLKQLQQQLRKVTRLLQNSDLSESEKNDEAALKSIQKQLRKVVRLIKNSTLPKSESPKSDKATLENIQEQLENVTRLLDTKKDIETIKDQLQSVASNLTKKREQL